MTAPVAAEPAPTLDPVLAGLAAVLSAHPPGTVIGDDCRVRHVDWVPRRRCSVVHEIAPAGGTTTLVAYEVTSAGTTARRPADDPALPGLPVALSPEQVRDRLAGILGASVHACRVTPARHRWALGPGGRSAPPRSR